MFLFLFIFVWSMFSILNIFFGRFHFFRIRLIDDESELLFFASFYRNNQRDVVFVGYQRTLIETAI